MNDWQYFFDEYAPRYDAEVFTRHTEAEVRFLVEQLTLNQGARILDVGCGTGRHGVALAKLGYQVTGVDLSTSMLQLARQRAESAGVSVEWVQSNAEQFVRPGEFDAAICLCEGALCLLGENDDPFEHDQNILRNIAQSLRARGRLVMNVLNACRQIRASNDRDIEQGRFDVDNLTVPSDAPPLLGEKGKTLRASERSYTPPEIRRVVKSVGFDVVGVYGGTAGDWGLRRLGSMNMS